MNIFEVLIVQPIFNLLLGLYSLVGDFGVAVIIFTILVRFALWPLAKKQLHQAKAMRKMQPELKKLQAKYKNNKQAQSMAMLDLYKKYNIGPFRSIAVLLIQLPILIGVYRVVQIFVMHREELGKFTYDIMEQLPTVGNLVQHPDQFNQNFLGIMDLTKHAVSPQGVAIGLVAFAALAAVLQYLLSKQTAPQSDSGKRLRDVLAEAEQGKEADQAEVNAIVMRKMMKFMPIFLFFIMINLPGALALYMTTSNAVAYIQNKMILRQDGDELEKIASEKQQKNAKKSPKQRAANAKEANVTRIKAKD